MTTIILTIIGILLAAAAALMVIFYGGDAFNAGSIGAQANTYQNAGTNVISAIQLAKADAATWTTVSSLHNASDKNADYLRDQVGLPNGSTGELTVTTGNGTRYEAVVLGGQATDVCSRINKNLKVGTLSGGVYTVTAAQSDGLKMGCVNDGAKFFANA